MTCLTCGLPADGYKLLTNPERTVLVRVWTDGTVEVASREHASHTWGPPAVVQEETS